MELKDGLTQEFNFTMLEEMPILVATGGTPCNTLGQQLCTNYKIHKFTGPGTFCTVSCAAVIAAAIIVDYYVVAGWRWWRWSWLRAIWRWRRRSWRI